MGPSLTEPYRLVKQQLSYSYRCPSPSIDKLINVLIKYYKGDTCCYNADLFSTA